MPDPTLLTPGPLTTTLATRAAMLRDWGSWDQAFNALTASVCRDILAIVHGQDSHVCVPLQGSGTFAVEAALGTLVPRTGKVLVPNNGAYCQRILRILETIGRQGVSLPFAEDCPVDPAVLEATLAADPAITHVALVHCETGTGILNPLPRIAAVVAAQGRSLIVDAMSTFGVIPIDAREHPFEAVIAASGKCLEGVPGMGFVVARKDALEQATGRCHSLAMDLQDQWQYLQKTGQWRFTPPTHVVAALRAAIDQYQAEGGLAGRAARYADNCQALVASMRRLGLQTFLPDAVQAPVIVTFHAPASPHYDFTSLYRLVRSRGFVLYPGKLTRIETFRVGCIGAIGRGDIEQAVAAIEAGLRQLGVPVSARTEPLSESTA